MSTQLFETSDLSELATQVRLTCQRISRRVRFEGTHEVAPHQFSVMARLVDGEKTPTRIAEIERVSTPSITRTLNCLQDDGIITRTPHPTDGRQVMVTLTDKGREIVARTLARRDSWMAERLATLTDTQLDVLRDAVEILAEVATK